LGQPRKIGARDGAIILSRYWLIEILLGLHQRPSKILIFRAHLRSVGSVAGAPFGRNLAAICVGWNRNAGQASCGFWPKGVFGCPRLTLNLDLAVEGRLLVDHFGLRNLNFQACEPLQFQARSRAVVWGCR
jgi:hypothetical protein